MWTYLHLILRTRTISSWWCKFVDANSLCAWNNASKISRVLLLGNTRYIVAEHGQVGFCSISVRQYGNCLKLKYQAYFVRLWPLTMLWQNIVWDLPWLVTKTPRKVNIPFELRNTIKILFILFSNQRTDFKSKKYCRLFCCFQSLSQFRLLNCLFCPKVAAYSGQTFGGWDLGDGLGVAFYNMIWVWSPLKLTILFWKKVWKQIK